MYVICKSESAPPAPACRRPGSSMYASSLAANRRQTGAELQQTSERSLIACSARCLAASSCCAFEFRADGGRCRLFYEAREDLWVSEEGSKIFGVGL